MIIHNPILTGSLVFNGTNLTTSNLVTTGSNNFTGSQSISGSLNVTGNITATTLVVQTVSSSVIYSSGSNVFGNNIANTQVMTGSVSITGSLAVVTNGTELQVTSTGVKLGNIITDSHPITGSVNVSGSATFLTSVTAGARIQAQGSNGAGTSYGGFLINYNANANSRSWLINNDYNTFGDFAILQTTTQTGLTFNNAYLYINPSGNVGIGTLNPNYLLSVNNVSDVWHLAVGDTSSAGKMVRIGGYGGNGTYGVIGAYSGQTNGSPIPLVLQRDGSNVIIGTPSANNSGTNLQVEGTASFGQMTLRFANAASGRHWRVGPDNANNFIVYNENNTGAYINYSATSWTANSDERLKDINKNIENAVEDLMTLRAVNFSWKSDESKKENLGLIAQDVEKVFPQVIDTNGEGMLGVRYTEMIPVLVKAIQELKAEIEILKTK